MTVASGQPLRLKTTSSAPVAFDIFVTDTGPGGRLFHVTGATPGSERPLERSFALAAAADHSAYLDFQTELAEAFGLRVPLARRPFEPSPGRARFQPLLTQPVSPEILYGYGDPSVLWVPEERAWYLVVTSNDAPNAFPILRSADLVHWSPAGFVFPAGSAPTWTLEGLGVSDFWAPELHRVGGEYWLCFAARQRDGDLAIGLARGAAPTGPFSTAAEPILGGGVIDPHLFAPDDGPPLLFWKEDKNELWPGRLCDLLHRRGDLIAILFDNEGDRRTAAFVQALWPWAQTLAAMERFFVLQPLIEAATHDFAAFRARLSELTRQERDLRSEIEAVLDAMTTRILAQPLSPDGRRLLGEPTTVLQNDLAWEAHLIEGVWVAEHAGRYYLFYAANDFSTAHYGVGVAVADHPLGPYRKAPAPLLQSSQDWWGPGHPSVAPGPGGRPHLFLHAFRPGAMGYKVFRALLMAELRFEDAQVVVG